MDIQQSRTTRSGQVDRGQAVDASQGCEASPGVTSTPGVLEPIRYMLVCVTAGGLRQFALATAAALGMLAGGDVAWAQQSPVTLTAEPAIVREGAGTVDIRVVARTAAPVRGGVVVIGPLVLNTGDARDLQIVGYLPPQDPYSVRTVSTGSPTFRIGNTETEDEVFLRVRVPHGTSGEGEETITLSAAVSGNPRYAAGDGLAITIIDTESTPGETRITQKAMWLDVITLDTRDIAAWPGGHSILSSQFFGAEPDGHRLWRLDVNRNHGHVTDVILVLSRSGIPTDTLFRFTYEVVGESQVVDLAVADAYLSDDGRRLNWGPYDRFNNDPDQGSKAYYGTLPNVPEHEWFTLEWVRVTDAVMPRVDRIEFTNPAVVGERFSTQSDLRRSLKSRSAN